MELTRTQKITSISLILLLATSFAFAALPFAAAHDPPWDIPTYAYLTVSPDPVGVDQTTFIVMWLDKVPPTAGGIGGDRWTGFMIEITKPDGTKQNMGPYISDATSAAWALYTPDQLGSYTFKFTFPGQTASLYHPVSGIPGSNSAYIGDYYEPSEATTTLTVQQEGVPTPPTYPLPETYWTRPIEGQNTLWSSIASNWFGESLHPNRFQPSGSAPGSAHVLWTKPYQDGGIVGGDYWHVPSAAYYTGLSYEGKLNTMMIMYGRVYFDTSLSDDSNDGPYVCVDLATGETLWETQEFVPDFGMLYLYESFNQHGVIGDGYLVDAVGGGFGGGKQTWNFYDARTGIYLFNMTNVPSLGGGFFGGMPYPSGQIGPSGEIINYEYSSGNWLAQWNSSAGQFNPLVATPGNTTNAFQYRPIGKSVDMSQPYAYDWNVSLAQLPPGSSILAAFPGDMILFYTSPTVGFFGWGTQEWTLTAISLKEFSKGFILWQQTYQPPAGNVSRSFGPVDPEARVITMVDKETMQWSGYDLDSGAHLWGPTGNFRDFQYYGQVSNPPAPGFAAYGNLYVAGYGGELHCFDMRTGATKWVYNNTFSGDQTPWGLYPIFISGIADGKVYLWTSEHSPNVPLYKGSKVRAVDAETGDEVFTVDSWYAIGSFGQSAAPIADGKMVYLNVYDMQLYCLGKGPSKTTVEAPLSGITQGQSMIIQGKVTDESVGAKKLIDEGKFNSVPAMSDESMGDWMAHIYMQKPIPADAVGVEVTLEAVGPDGFIEIGTATTDTSGLYSIAWTPDTPGKYTIIATFKQTDSYYYSYDETAVVVDQAPQASPTAPPTTAPPTTAPPTTVPPTEEPTTAPPVTPSAPGDDTGATNMYIIAAVAIVIIVAAAAAAVFLRRRK